MAEKTSFKKELLEYVRVIMVTVIVTYIILYFVQVSRVVGTSMMPNYHDGQIVLINRRFYSYDKADYGDVVVAKVDFGDGEEQIIKRIIGKEGDTIAYDASEHELTRNGEVLSEEYIYEIMADYDDWSYTVGENQVFIMGDNRNNSSDSRIIGPVDFEDITGNVFFKMF